MTLDKRLHSLMDRTTVSGTVGAGSIPAGGAKLLVIPSGIQSSMLLKVLANQKEHALYK